jgi:hypothetical protein
MSLFAADTEFLVYMEKQAGRWLFSEWRLMVDWTKTGPI